MIKLFEYLEESSIDFPQKDLDLKVWKKVDGTYTLRSKIKRQILDLLSKYPEEDLVDMAKVKDGLRVIHVIGSICTNQYLDDSDIDIHVIVSQDSKYFGDEDFQNDVIKWYAANADELKAYVGEHKLEVYMQYNESQDLLSAGCYDLMADKWIIGPRIYPLDYDPYEDFADVFKTVHSMVQDADILFGELKRDVIDYDVIKLALQKIPKSQRQHLKDRLQDKLQEIEDDILLLYKERKDWVDARRKSSKPVSVENAKDDVELAKKWNDANALFKFINRYKYLKTIRDLEEILGEDNKLSPGDVDSVKDILKV
jgi:hypothetical protein